MKLVDVVVLLYAILSIVLGILGYVAPTTGHPSVISLIAGGVAGALLIGSLAFAKTNPRIGRIGAAVISLLLVLRFAKPFLMEGKFYPAGLMFLGGLVTVGVLVGGHLAANRKKAQI